MLNYPDTINKLIESFSRLPGVGRKTAERFIFHVLKWPKDEVEKFSFNIKQLLAHNFLCPNCFNFSEHEGLCSVCSNPHRDTATLCVVEEFHDVQVLEATGAYRGLYHVLGGLIDPPEGITPDKLRVRELLERVKKNNTREIILGLNPDIQGEGTVIYLKNILRPLNVKVTLLARGLPMGGDIEYADEVTLTNALKGRQEIK